MIAEIEFAVDVILDKGNSVPGQQIHQRPLLVVGHQAAQGILEIGHEPARLGAVALQGMLQRQQIDALAWMGGNLHHLQTHALERLQRGIEGGRFHHHGVTRSRHGRQAKV
ncbi:hypothetical protein D9M68_737980 [compost metagenome]